MGYEVKWVQENLGTIFLYKGGCNSVVLLQEQNRQFKNTIFYYEKCCGTIRTQRVNMWKFIN